MKWIKASGTLYHVTHTNLVGTIQSEGIIALKTSNWINPSTDDRYGGGYIYALNNLKDAIRWGGKMDWDFNKEMGGGKISIIEFNDTEGWEVDDADPMSQISNEGQWLKRVKFVAPESITSAYPITHELIQKHVTQAE